MLDPAIHRTVDVRVSISDTGASRPLLQFDAALVLKSRDDFLHAMKYSGALLYDQLRSESK